MPVLCKPKRHNSVPTHKDVTMSKTYPSKPALCGFKILYTHNNMFYCHYNYKTDTLPDFTAVVYYEIPDTNNSFLKTTTHSIIIMTVWCNLETNSYALLSHSALFLPPDVEQMSKRANDSWAREVCWLLTWYLIPRDPAKSIWQNHPNSGFTKCSISKWDHVCSLKFNLYAK